MIWFSVAFMRLVEEQRAKRRTIADALGVVERRKDCYGSLGSIEIRVLPLTLPSGKATGLVDVVFPDIGCEVSLATSTRFKARCEQSSTYRTFEISLLNSAKACADGSVCLANGTRLRAVEVLPAYLPYEPTELDNTILMNVIAQTQSYYCFREIQYGLPEHLRHEATEWRLLDYSRVATI